MSILKVQQKLKAAGLDPGPLDGKWGAKTEQALNCALSAARDVDGTVDAGRLAWGGKVSRHFRIKARDIAGRLGVEPDDLMACMAWETGRTFSPSIRNAAGSGAVGLIQFMPATAKALGTDVASLARMSVEQQLDYVERYFQPYRGKLKNLGDLYMAILWPAGVGKPNGYVLWDSGTRPKTYRQNAGIDINRDGVITRAEALAKVNGLLLEGLSTANVWCGA